MGKVIKEGKVISESVADPKLVAVIRKEVLESVSRTIQSSVREFEEDGQDIQQRIKNLRHSLEQAKPQHAPTYQRQIRSLEDSYVRSQAALAAYKEIHEQIIKMRA